MSGQPPDAEAQPWHHRCTCGIAAGLSLVVEHDTDCPFGKRLERLLATAERETLSHAADELPGGMSSNGARKWLRDRADRIDVDAPEHTHETGGTWHVTRWQVPGCPACAEGGEGR